MGNTSLNFIMKLLKILIWFSFLFCSNSKTFNVWLSFPELISLCTSIHSRSFHCVFSKVCTEAASLLKILMRLLEVLYVPIELLFISSCFPSIAKQAGMGGLFRWGRKQITNSVRRLLVGTVLTVWVGVAGRMNLHFRCVYRISCLTVAGCKPAPDF